ncbi:MAG: UDP-glucose/GDP-mannose dehydrogenase family protein [Candidatus Marinimicrobia bacterium]|nr:UDP-glucose/GDP-mannose dehydrogenase family protein [Candidatus Neomarinimicrobiota bacterium]
MKKICVVGTGYVGLVTAAGLADFGNSVIGVDIDESKIKILQEGGIPIYEPGLLEVVQRNVRAGRLSFTTNIDQAIQDSKVIFSAVGTPPGEGGEADLRAVWAVATSFAKNLNNYKVFINKSTVPVGTGKKTLELIMENSEKKDYYDVVSNPEFLREGSAVGDFLNPDRVVVGSRSEKAQVIMKDVYHALIIRGVPYVETNIESAELIKYASNAFLAVKITFINEIANLCDIVGGDVSEIAKAMGLDGRISPKFLHAGPGFGGSCFPKDTMALVEIFKEHGVKSRVVEATIEANEYQKEGVVAKLRSVMPDLKGKTIAILGLAFKPETDDTRFSPAKVVISLLEKEGATVQVYDPVASDDFKRDFPDLNYKKNAYDAIEGADAMVLMTEWNEFRSLDMKRVKKLLKTPIFIDTRNTYDPRDMKDKGFTFVCTGRTKCAY